MCFCFVSPFEMDGGLKKQCDVSFSMHQSGFSKISFQIRTVVGLFAYFAILISIKSESNLGCIVTARRATVALNAHPHKGFDAFLYLLSKHMSFSPPSDGVDIA